MLPGRGFIVLDPEPHETPAHHVQAALASPPVIADHREQVGGRHVPTGWEVRGGPMRRDREDELDLADIGGETGAATHGAKDNGTGAQAQAAGPCSCIPDRERLENITGVPSEAPMFFTFPSTERMKAIGREQVNNLADV